MRNQRGYTLVELLFVCGFIGALCAVGFLIYIVAHFVIKFW